MKIIKISDRKFKEARKLCKEYNEFYGDANTVWDFDDVNSMREIGGEFMAIFASHFEK